MRREDMVLGAFILVPILCLIIPVPLFLLDLLFALNIALSMIILFFPAQRLLLLKTVLLLNTKIQDNRLFTIRTKKLNLNYLRSGHNEL